MSEDIRVAYVGIGNSDDKLTQREWVCFQMDTKEAVHARTSTVIYGEWHSYPDSIFQNACYCFEVDAEQIPELKGTLAAIAVEYRQDAISWVETTDTEFLGPGEK